MKRYGWMVVIILVFNLSLLGCEKLPWGGRPKEEVKPPEVPAVVEKGEVLAKVNDRIITLEEFKESFALLPEELRELYLKDPKGKEIFLNELVGRELLIKEGIRRRLYQDEEVVREVARLRDQLLLEKLVIMEREKVRVTSAEVENYYETFKAEFVIPEERRVRAIVVATEEEAKAALIELLRGADFATLARERSIGPNKEKGGEIGFIVRVTTPPQPGKQTVFPKFEEAAFSLELGGVSGIIKGPYGYYIIKVEEIKKAGERSLYEVWDDIERGLLIVKQNQAVMMLVEDLRKTAAIEINRELLEAK